MIETPPTFEERYIGATNSSNLRVNDLASGDVDYLIAVGLAGRPRDQRGETPERIIRRHELATCLLHLQGEWDQQKRAIGRAKDYLSPMRERAWEARCKVWHGKHSLAGPTQELYFIELAELDEASIVGGAIAHAMLSLKSLRAAKEALHRWAEIEATCARYMVTDAEIAKLIGPMLEVFLDPNCHKCGGRGVIGDHGTVQTICPACHGSKVRFGRKGGRGIAIGQTPEQHRFADYVTAEIGRMVAQMRERSSGYLRC